MQNAWHCSAVWTIDWPAGIPRKLCCWPALTVTCHGRPDNDSTALYRLLAYESVCPADVASLHQLTLVLFAEQALLAPSNHPRPRTLEARRF